MGKKCAPDSKINVKSFYEIAIMSKTSDISSCLFSGIYRGNEISIVVDFSLKNISIMFDEEIILEEIENIIINKLSK